MLKRHSQLFEILFVITDLIVVSIAWYAAYRIRFEWEVVPVEKGIPPFANYQHLLFFIWIIWAFIFRRMGLYRPMRGVARSKEFWMLLNANGFSTLCFIAVVYLFREKDFSYSRLVFGYFWALASLFTICHRFLLRALLREIRRQGYNLRFLLIVGSERLAGDIATRIRLHRELGIQVIGCLSKTGTEKKGAQGIPVVGSYKDLATILAEREIDKVIVALPLEDNYLVPEIMAAIGDLLIDVKIVPDILQFVTLGGYIEEFEGLPVISVQTSPLDGINLTVKRGFDLLLATCLSIITLPVMGVIGLIIKITSGGPVIFSQERVSIDGTKFFIFKFRTMRSDSEREGPGWTTPGDGRITRFGRLLRSFSLDELPQLFNVLKGDMSIVGPRPERPVYIEEFRQRIPRYMLRHKVPAGITGWAQVNGWRGDTSIGRRIEHDLYYIENWSLFLDFKILFLTLFRGFKNRNAY